MKRTLRSLSALACSAMCLVAAAQENKYVPPLGTKTLYRPGNDTDAPAPPGYSPFFINYVGRHGARHATGDGEFLRLQHCLQEAADAGALHPDGVRLLRMIQAIAAVESKYPSGTLTTIGESEQYTIGKDMGDRYPDVVRRSEDCLEITTTPELRTVQSAEQFLKGLASSSNCVTRISNDSIRLRFFSLSPAYTAFVKKGDWRKAQAQLESSVAYRQANADILHRLFDGSWVSKLEQGQVEGFNRPDAFVMAVYAAAVIAPGLRDELQALGYRPEDADIFSLLTAREAAELDLIDAAKDFFVKGPGLDSMGIQTRIAAPLLADLVESSDQGLAADKKGADLRFAHAETIAPIAALMGCEGAATAVSDPVQYAGVWHSDRVMGYSANIQWIFYRRGQSGRPEHSERSGNPLRSGNSGGLGDSAGLGNSAGSGNPGGSGQSGDPRQVGRLGRPIEGADEDLVKVLYNERPVHLPIETDHYPFYSWKKLRAYYLHKLHTLNLAPGQDMYAWLQQLQ